MKFDPKKELDSYRARRGVFELVSVPRMQYLMIDGHGDPNTATAYADALATLYPVAYKLKFFSKRELDRDYVVGPLEALWWSADMAAFTSARDKSRWDWTAMIVVPDWLTDDHVEAARSTVERGGGAPLLGELRCDCLDEGLAVQTLHIGSYDDEADVLAAMHDDFIPSHGLAMSGLHHEIYLSDPRRVAASKLRTILRQPVVLVAS
uniref:GyrI-like small molecule binding domain-containing protein n=1 Tax=uncultured bacterium A1Q1_fos_515 TaxID=1256581 RepID=L7VVG9_9BACT|nr:hypothetical protein [uncultured bacterium A1Q1_fos_515]